MKKCLLLGLSVFVVIFIIKIAGIRFNYTNSMPIGFYIKIKTSTIRDGDIVAACLPDDIALIGMRNHYLARGSCKNGSVPVLKKLIAVPGDSVSLNNQFITVNGISYLAPRQPKDNHGHRVEKIFKNKRYSHTSMYWLYGANDPFDSWDSRYYGGVTRQHIIGVYKSLLTF